MNTTAQADTKNYLKAIRLINIEDSKCSFEIGRKIWKTGCRGE